MDAITPQEQKIDAQFLKRLKEPSEGKKPRYKLIVFTVGLLLLIAAVMFFLAKSSVFSVEKFSFTPLSEQGFTNFDKAGVESVLKSEFNGDNIFLLNLDAVHDQVDSSSPFVKVAYAKKNPPHEVTIYVEERDPFMVINDGESCALLDPGGYTLETYSVDSQTKKSLKKGETICKSTLDKYPVFELSSEEIKTEFKLDEQSTFFDTEHFYLLKNALKDRGYEISSVKLGNGLYEVYLGKKRLIISATQDFEIQVKRFILVSDQIEKSKLNFSKLDLRYERPVLTK